MDLRNFSDYFFEHLASGNGPGVLPISSACNAKCVFCSNDNNPFEIKKCKARPLSEIEKVVWSMPKDFKGDFILNEAITSKLSEGEVFTHPELFDILKCLRGKYRDKKIVISSNGSMITDDNIRELARFKPVTVSISIHSFNEKYWKHIFQIKKQKYYENAINSFDVLQKYRIPMGIRVIAMPALVGYDDLENTIIEAKKRNIKFIGMTHASWTRFTPPEVVEEMKVDPYELGHFVDSMMQKHDVKIAYTEHPNKTYDFNVGRIKTIANAYAKKFDRVYWFTSSKVHNKLDKIIKEISDEVNLESHVIEVENATFGGTINCAGLWTIKDIDNTIKKHNLNNEFIILPGRFLNKFGYDLMGDNIVDYMKVCENRIKLI